MKRIENQVVPLLFKKSSCKSCILLATKEPIDFNWEIMYPAKNWFPLNLRDLGRITVGRELAVSARLWEGYYFINH